MRISKFIFILLLAFCWHCSIGQDTNPGSLSPNYRNGILNPVFFDQLLGNYITTNKEIIVIGRSQKKLFAYFERTQSYRGLNRINDTVWKGGHTVIADEVINTLVFKKDKLEILEKGVLVTSAKKTQLYTTENIFFNNSTGIQLGGTVFKPLMSNGKAIVLVHGSGNQDRNGNNACMRILADVLVRQGITVLTFDKQGVGSSSGNWETLNFTQLAADALSGLGYLKERKDLQLSKIGLGGYSQAGWIIARAIQQSKNIDFALTINAAGSGITVADQNIYDVKTQMECEDKFSKRQKEQVILQQRYFFDYLLQHKNGPQLDDLTTVLKKDTLLKEWLYPNTSEINIEDKSQWYNALEVGFDPLPTWQQYHKPVLMIVSEFDDSTPATVVLSNVKKLNNKHITLKFMKGCQHLGLVTNSVCNAKINGREKFTPVFFKGITDWIVKL